MTNYKINETKTCQSCQQMLPLFAFYKGTGLQGVQANCKNCHNKICVARVRKSPQRKRQNAKAKANWNARNKARTRLHIQEFYARKSPVERRQARGRSILPKKSSMIRAEIKGLEATLAELRYLIDSKQKGQPRS